MTVAKKMSTKKKPNGPKRAKPPHNAGRPKGFRTIAELAQAIGAEPRRAIIRSEEVTISQAKRLCSSIVEKAIAGSASDLKFLIRTMADHPEIVGSSKEQWVLLLAGTDAEL